MAGWTVGEEREITQGNYALFAAQASGWRLWRFETSQVMHWVVSKAVIGQLEPHPLGVDQMMYGGAPRVRVVINDRPLAFVSGRYLHILKSEWRVVGERLMRDVPNGFDPLPYEGSKLELVVASLPGPRAFTKLSRDYGTIDMSGIAQVVSVARSEIRSR